MNRFSSKIPALQIALADALRTDDDGVALALLHRVHGLITDLDREEAIRRACGGPCGCRCHLSPCPPPAPACRCGR